MPWTYYWAESAIVTSVSWRHTALICESAAALWRRRPSLVTLEYCLTTSCPCESMSPRWHRRASTTCADYVPFDVNWAAKWRLGSSTHYYCQVWTTATPYSLVARRQHWLRCRECSTRNFVWCLNVGHAIMCRQPWKLCTGCRSVSGLITSCVWIHKASIGQVPAYLTDMLAPCADVSSKAALRSHNNGDYVIPRNTLKFGERAFSVATSRAWNYLPTTLEITRCTDTFKRRPKSNSFYIAYK